MNKNHYQVLGVSQNASQGDIKKAYRSLSFQYHPDKTNGDKDKEEIYKKINEAYDVLQDTSRRQQYDFEIMMMGNPNDFIHHEFIGQTDLTDIIGQLFGSMKQPKKTKVNPMHMMQNMEDIMFMQFPQEKKEEFYEDISHYQEITFEEAYSGLCLPITIKRQIFHGQNSFSEESESLYIDIPKGVDHNEIIVLKEKGHVYGKKKSDVKVHIVLKPHKHFQRKGMDIIYTHFISLKESFLGFSFVLEHINKQTMKLNNPKGRIIYNQNERTIPNLGFQREDKTGNLIITFKVKEEQLNETQLEGLEKWFETIS